MSDNGGCQGNAPLRANKGSIHEGGIRVPMIFKWPAVVSAGRRCSVPVISTDFHDTFVEIGGGDPNNSRTADGLSLVPLLKGGASLPREALYWHFPHRGKIGNSGAIRKGRYKLIEKFATGSIELYDLARDIGEKYDLSDDKPEMAAQLHRELKDWRQQVGARMR